MSEIIPQIAGDAASSFLETAARAVQRREKLILSIGSLLCFLMFWYAGKLFRIPLYSHFSACLLQQPTWATSLMVAAIVYAAAVLVGALICGAVAFDAGLFCASIGLCALSIRGGAMRFTLQSATGPEIWRTLTVELVMLVAIVCAGCFVQALLRTAGLLRDDSQREIVVETHDAINHKVLALCTTVIVIAGIMLLLCATDRKGQCLMSVGIASFVGVLVAYYMFPAAPSVWFWCGPLIVGIAGYAIQQFTGGAGWEVGQVRGTFAPLARPLPLDYAGAGVAWAIMGYWVARRWQHERETSPIPEN